MGAKILKIYKKTANFLGRINTKIILSVFYFTVVPVFKAVSMFTRSKNTQNSNWKIKNNSDPDAHRHSF